MAEPRIEDPGPAGNNRGTLFAAVEAARDSPGKWVLAQEYKSQNVATTTGVDMKRRYEGIETTTRGSKLFVRVAD